MSKSVCSSCLRFSAILNFCANTPFAPVDATVSAPIKRFRTASQVKGELYWTAQTFWRPGAGVALSATDNGEAPPSLRPA